MAAALSIFFAVTVSVAPPAAAQASSSLQDVIPSGRVVGQGRLRFWGMDVYDASLTVAPGFRHGEFASHAFALQLHYLRAFSAADVARRALEEMRRVGGFSDALAQQWQTGLARLLPDIQAGDRVTGVNRPGRGVLFVANGRTLGEFGDAQFARLFFSIWLGAQTSEPALRDALLAGTAP